ncbi:MAG TPA: polysaccharide biosynthesis tyrosine autokinase [Blastocatellia bacterium]|nr:polysaccharide biosynthesis tyrosine autokinase [Blastocatellia bacterium]
MAEQSKIQLFEPLLPRPNDRRLELLKGYDSPEDAAEGAYLRAYWRIFRNRRWTILSAIAVVLTVVTIYTVRQKPVYQATSMLEIEQENPNVVTLSQIFQIQSVSEDYLSTQYKILQSDSLARDVIQTLHLDQAKDFNPSPGAWPWQAKKQDPAAGPARSTDAAHEQGVLGAFKARLTVTPVPQSRLVSVAFESYDSKLAATVANALVSTYIQQNLYAHWQASQQASSWLSQQLDGLKIKLEKSEDALQQYVQANGLLFLESNTGGTQNIVEDRLQQLQNELTQAQADLYQKEPLYHLVVAGEYSALPGVFDNKTLQDLTAKLADLEQQKALLTPNFQPSYPKMEAIQSEIDRTQQFINQEQQQAAEHIKDEYLAAVRRVALVQQAFDQQQKQANVVAEKSVEYNILKREVDSDKQTYDGLLDRLKEASVSAGLKASNIRVVDPAVPPISPVKPRVPFNLAIGLVMGLVCGVSLAFVEEYMDNTLKTPDDIESFLRQPALALIPSSRAASQQKNGHRESLPRVLLDSGEAGKSIAARKRSQNGWLRVDSEAFRHSPLSEAFRALRTSVLLSTAARPPRSLVFVSAEPGEGKTTICNNLAITLAQLGKSVLVVDGDMRRPRVHDFFHVDNSSGLVNYLTGDVNWQALVQPSGMKGLACLACGPIPPNPSELLSSEQMQRLINEATAAYDILLLDAPPLLNVADGRILSTMVEGVVLVVKGGTTPREMVRRAEIYVSDVGAHLLGVVLNDIDMRRDGYYYSRYDYYSEGNGESKA